MGALSAVRRRLAGGSVDERLSRLEDEIQECRQMHLRLAELYDVVTELLIPLANRDDAKAAELLDHYRAEVSSPTVSQGDA